MEIFCEVNIEENEILYTKRCPKDRVTQEPQKKKKSICLKKNQTKQNLTTGKAMYCPTKTMEMAQERFSSHFCKFSPCHITLLRVTFYTWNVKCNEIEAVSFSMHEENVTSEQRKLIC